MPAEARANIPVRLLITSVVLGSAYFATIPYHPFPGSAVIKGASIGTLGLAAWRTRSVLLTLALLASTTGDVLLDLDARYFTAGLCAFLSAHLLYVLLFGRWRMRSLGRVFLGGLVVVYAGVFGAFLAPSLGAMRVPVVVYIVVITAMVISALLSKFPAVVPAGAMLFLLSDSLLATAKFKGAFPLRDYLVWATYYAAQYAITWGVLSASGGRIGGSSRAAAATSPR